MSSWWMGTISGRPGGWVGRVGGEWTGKYLTREGEFVFDVLSPTADVAISSSLPMGVQGDGK